MIPPSCILRSFRRIIVFAAAIFHARAKQVRDCGFPFKAESCSILLSDDALSEPWWGMARKNMLWMRAASLWYLGSRSARIRNTLTIMPPMLCATKTIGVSLSRPPTKGELYNSANNAWPKSCLVTKLPFVAPQSELYGNVCIRVFLNCGSSAGCLAPSLS